MAEYISTFTTGFSQVIKKNLPEILANVKIINVSDGLIHYQYNGNSRDIEKIVYFNNTFFLIKTLQNKNLNFSNFVNIVSKTKHYYLINKGKFRIRFIQENQFVKVDKNISRRAEEIVLKNSKLQIDRVTPTTEIWYSIRRDGFAYCGQLLHIRSFTEKNLNKGELRPEVAFLICAFAEIKNNQNILDCFCGFGSIPLQLAKNYKSKISHLYISDLDKEKISLLKQNPLFINNELITITENNAFVLDYIKDKSIDVVITDPPWGFYEDIPNIKEFYENMFNSFKRILSEQGYMVILSARKEELQFVCSKMNLKIKKDLHTLINGKKAGLYLISF